MNKQDSSCKTCTLEGKLIALGIAFFSLRHLMYLFMGNSILNKQCSYPGNTPIQFKLDTSVLPGRPAFLEEVRTTVPFLCSSGGAWDTQFPLVIQGDKPTSPNYQLSLSKVKISSYLGVCLQSFFLVFFHNGKMFTCFCNQQQKLKSFVPLVKIQITRLETVIFLRKPQHYTLQP